MSSCVIFVVRGAYKSVERESSPPGVSAAGRRKRSATLTTRRVRSFSSVARWNEPGVSLGVSRARSTARAFRRLPSIVEVNGFAAPRNRRAIRSISSNVSTASRRSSSVAPVSR